MMKPFNEKFTMMKKIVLLVDNALVIEKATVIRTNDQTVATENNETDYLEDNTWLNLYT